MIKVIIVDDEVLIRVGIKSCIQWEEYGFEIVGQASDGLQALDIIYREKPDIVLTDIKMPNMDGLELLSEINHKYPQIKVIVLSCHNELDYVKKAMKMGAEDYILKLSMEPETLVDVLNRTKKAIDSEKEKNFEYQNTENVMRTNKYLIKENLYRKFLDGSIPFAEFDKKIKQLGVIFDEKQYTILCCEIDDYANAPVKSHMEDQHMLKFSFLNILEECLYEYGEGDIAEVSSGAYIIWMFFENPDQGIGLRSSILECCRKVNNALKKYLNISVSFGIAPACNSFTRIPEAHQLAHQALLFKFYLGRESVIFFDEIKGFSDKGMLFDLETEKLLAEYMQSLDADSAKGLMNRFFESLQLGCLYSPAKLKSLSAEILYAMLKILRKLSYSSELIDSIKEDYTLDRLMAQETLLDLRAWFNGLTDRIVGGLCSLQQSSIRPEIAAIRSYIMEHIHEEITLDMAARISHISKNYLSSIFKKETGEGFIDYVNRLKTEKARELICEYGLKTYEAAERVGITDESYFSKLFKKHMGVSPSKVKKR